MDLRHFAGARWIRDTEPTDALPVDVFARAYFHPGLLRDVLRGVALPPVPDLDTISVLRPAIEISSERVDSLVIAKVDVCDGGGGARDLRVFRDDKLVAWRDGALATGGCAAYAFEIDVPSSPADVALTAYAFNDDRVKGETAHTTLTKLPRAQSEQRAFLVHVGIDDYSQTRFPNLSFAIADAEALEQSLGGLLRTSPDVTTVVSAVIDDSQTLERTLAVLSGAAPPGDANGFTRARPDDIVIITFAGHGYTGSDGAFYLAFSDRSVSEAEFARWLRGVDADNMVLILDACQSAASVEGEGFKPGPLGSRGFGQLAYDKGMMVLAASQSDAVALENASLRHGLLTWVLVEDGLVGGAADMNGDGRIRLQEWLRHAELRVPEVAAAIRANEPIGRGWRGARSAPLVSATATTAPAQQPRLFSFGQPDGITLWKKAIPPVTSDVSPEEPKLGCGGLASSLRDLEARAERLSEELAAAWEYKQGEIGPLSAMDKVYLAETAERTSADAIGARTALDDCLRHQHLDEADPQPRVGPLALHRIEPAWTDRSGGQRLVLTTGPITTNTVVTVGGVRAEVVDATENTVTVRAPPGKTQGFVDVVVTDAARTASLRGGFSYWNAATDGVGAIGSMTTTNHVPEDPEYGPEEPGASVDLTFTLPVDLEHHYQIWAHAIDTCTTHAKERPEGGGVPGWQPIPIPLDARRGLETASAEMQIAGPDEPLLVPWRDMTGFSGWVHPIDPGSYGLSSMTGVPAPWTDLELPGLFAAAPAFALEQPELARTQPPTIPQRFDVRWDASNTADYVMVRVDRFDASDEIAEVVTCAVKDDGRFRMPKRVFTGWEAGARLSITVGRFAESKTVLPYSGARVLTGRGTAVQGRATQG
jgi:hypothetical protein